MLVSTKQKESAKPSTKHAQVESELSSSGLSCSISNRQFRAKVGLISHLTVTLRAFD